MISWQVGNNWTWCTQLGCITQCRRVEWCFLAYTVYIFNPCLCQVFKSPSFFWFVSKSIPKRVDSLIQPHGFHRTDILPDAIRTVHELMHDSSTHLSFIEVACTQWLCLFCCLCGGSDDLRLCVAAIPSRQLGIFTDVTCFCLSHRVCHVGGQTEKHGRDS